MKDILLNVFEKINLINKEFNIITKDEINEEYENIHNFNKTIKKLNSVMENINEETINEKDSLRREIVHLHLAIGDIEWQLDQIHDMIRKIGLGLNDKE